MGKSIYYGIKGLNYPESWEVQISDQWLKTKLCHCCFVTQTPFKALGQIWDSRNTSKGANRFLGTYKAQDSISWGRMKGWGGRDMSVVLRLYPVSPFPQLKTTLSIGDLASFHGYTSFLGTLSFKKFFYYKLKTFLSTSKRVSTTWEILWALRIGTSIIYQKQSMPSMWDKDIVFRKPLVPVTNNWHIKLQGEVYVLSLFQRVQLVLAKPQPGAVQHGRKYVEMEALLHMTLRNRGNGCWAQTHRFLILALERLRKEGWFQSVYTVRPCLNRTKSRELNTGSWERSFTEATCFYDCLVIKCGWETSMR